MDEIKQRMLLSPKQQRAVIHLDDHGVHDPAPLFVMDFDTWLMYEPRNFFSYFAPKGTVAAYARYRPAWQRFIMLYPLEAKILQGIYDRLDNQATKILSSKKLAKRFYDAYAIMSSLVDELDTLVDKDLKSWGKWNHGYVINDHIEL